MYTHDKSRERVFLLISSTTMREQPAYCPDNGAASFEDAYASFSFESEEAAQAEIEDIIQTRRADYDEVEPGEIPGEVEEFTRRGIILEDGSIQFTDHPEIVDDIMTVQKIFKAYGIEIPDFSAKFAP